MGVSKAAMSILNSTPLISSPKKLSHEIMPKEHNNSSTVRVSTICEENVEKLFRSHR